MFNIGLDWRVNWWVSLENKHPHPHSHSLPATPTPPKGSFCLWKLSLTCLQMEPDERNFRSWSSPGRSESPVWRTKGENGLFDCGISTGYLELWRDLGRNCQAGSGPLEPGEQRGGCMGTGTNEANSPHLSVTLKQQDSPVKLCPCLAYMYVCGGLFLLLMGFLVELQSDSNSV